MIFNAKESIPLPDLLSEIQGTAKEVKKHVLGLVKGKVLTKTSKGRVLNSDDVLTVNTNFSNKLIRVQLEIVPGEIEEEKTKKPENFENDRKFLIEAAIVRIMKSRRTLEHRLLVADVIKLSQIRFTPDIKMIKDRIEALIQREFIKRDTDSNEVYHYIS